MAPQLQTINLFISLTASLRHEIGLGDLEEALLQGKRNERLLFVAFLASNKDSYVAKRWKSAGRFEAVPTGEKQLGHIILVTDHVLDSGHERHQARTLRCSEGVTFNGRWTKMEKDFAVRVNKSTYIARSCLMCACLQSASESFLKSGTMAVMWCAMECRSETLANAAKPSHACEKVDGAASEGDNT